ncbi:Putative peroxiredoxin bcp [Paenibacillus solanacearum]|uniref:thioredoxin-dependent peroxiredoxin n=1 Tax=Paenibacillus solanacearum TaxID=2048548 RepID=A0A916NQI0_9BACL|nr:peroxiredoxin [Paenibacillus solanacearum]CAG7625189.1 Putative peroxiredoxin bcp [Paenibacillus solanacearum]
MLAIGTPAPAFSAESTQGAVRLTEILGRRPVVLIFYPKDETPICTKQLCAVRDSQTQYAAYDALVVGVNPGTVTDHRKFAEKYGYDFPLVADEGERIRELYDVGHMLLGLLGQQRTVYVIDRDGTIVYAKKGNRPTREIIEALAAGQHRPS